jgi:hypothetical protein
MATHQLFEAILTAVLVNGSPSETLLVLKELYIRNPARAFLLNLEVAFADKAAYKLGNPYSELDEDDLIGGLGDLFDEPDDLIGEPGDLFDKLDDLIREPGDPFDEPDDLIGEPGDLFDKLDDLIGEPGDPFDEPDDHADNPNFNPPNNFWNDLPKEKRLALKKQFLKGRLRNQIEEAKKIAKQYPNGEQLDREQMSSWDSAKEDDVWQKVKEFMAQLTPTDEDSYKFDDDQPINRVWLGRIAPFWWENRSVDKDFAKRRQPKIDPLILTTAFDKVIQEGSPTDLKDLSKSYLFEGGPITEQQAIKMISRMMMTEKLRFYPLIHPWSLISNHVTKEQIAALICNHAEEMMTFLETNFSRLPIQLFRWIVEIAPRHDMKVFLEKCSGKLNAKQCNFGDKAYEVMYKLRLSIIYKNFTTIPSLRELCCRYFQKPTTSEQEKQRFDEYVPYLICSSDVN